MQMLAEKRIKIIHRNGQKVSEPVPSKKGLTFLGFFSSPKGAASVKNATILKAAAPKSLPPGLPRVDLAAVKSWVALEEKIVHDYKEQKTVQSKNSLPAPKAPAKQPLPAFETFTIQTGVSLSPGLSKQKDLRRRSKRVFPDVVVLLLACGCLAAGTFVFLHVQSNFSSREAAERLVQLQKDHKQQELAYATLKNVSEDQKAEAEWLKSQLHNRAVELKTVKAQRVAFEQGLETRYREELMRITVRYESEIAALRGALETQKSIVSALRAQSQAFEKIMDQVGMSALSGAAAGFSREPFPSEKTASFQGEVTAVNERQGSVVISMGAIQGARSGRWITISRSGIGLATGRIDRVYPTMSVVMVGDGSMLQVIEEGDSVSFS